MSAVIEMYKILIESKNKKIDKLEKQNAALIKLINESIAMLTGKVEVPEYVYEEEKEVEQ